MKSCFLFLVLQFAVLSVSGQKNAVKPDGVSIIRGSGNAEQVEAVSNAEETDTVMEEEPDNALIARNLSRTLLTSYSRLKFNSGAMTGIQAKVNHNNSYSVLRSPAVTVVLEVQSQNLDFESFFEAEKDFLSKSTVYTQLKTALSQCEQTCVHSDVGLIPHSSFLLPNEDVSDSVTLRWKIKNKDASKNVPVDAFGVFLYSNDGDRLVEILEPIATLSRSWVLFDLFTSRSKSYDKAIALISELRNQFFQNLQHPMSCRAESDGFTLPSDILTSAETPTVQKCTKNNLTYRGVESKSAMVLSQTTTVENRKPRNLLDVEFLQILFLHFSVTQSVLSAQPNATISVVIGMTSKTKAVRSMSMRIPLRVLTSTRFCQASEEHFECGYTQTFAAPNDLKEITILALVPPSVTLYEAVMVHMQLSKPDGLALYQEILLERDMDLALSTYNWDQEEENWLVLANSNQDSQTTYSEKFVIKNVPPLYDALLQLYKLEQVVIHHDVTLPPESFDLYNFLPEEVFNEHQELDLSETDVSLTDASEQLNVLDEELEQMKKTSQNWKSEIQNINDEVKALNEIQGVYKNKQTLAQEFVTRSKSVDELLVQLREQNVSLQQQMSDFKDKFDAKKGSIEEERAEVEGLISSLSEKQKEVSDLYSKTNSALETQFQRAQDLLKNARPQPTPIMPSWAAGLISFFTTSTVILLASILFFTFKKPSLLPASATDASLHNTHGRGDGDEEVYDQLS